MSVDLKQLELDGVFEITPDRVWDDRGFFSQTWSARSLTAMGIDLEFVQDTHCMARSVDVLHGLHYQLPPFAQDKLVRVLHGAIFNVAVDIRPHSPTFGQWVGVEISDEKWNQVLVPKGYAHGFLTLKPDTSIVFKVSQPDSAEHDRCIRFDDPALGIEWPLAHGDILMSSKDRAAPFLIEAQLSQPVTL